jgi:hypothetical protein
VKLFKITPSPLTLYPFGARAIAHIPIDNWKKLDEQGIECQLLGYPIAGSGWLFWCAEQKQMIHTTSAVFPDFVDLSQIKVVLGEEPTEKIVIDNLPVGFKFNLPKNIKFALKCPQGPEWRKAAKYEIDKFKSLNV